MLSILAEAMFTATRNNSEIRHRHVAGESEHMMRRAQRRDAKRALDRAFYQGRG